MKLLKSLSSFMLYKSNVKNAFTNKLLWIILHMYVHSLWQRVHIHISFKTGLPRHNRYLFTKKDKKMGHKIIRRNMHTLSQQFRYSFTLISTFIGKTLILHFFL